MSEKDMTVRRVRLFSREYRQVHRLIKTAFPKQEQYPMWLLWLIGLRKSTYFWAYLYQDQFCGLSYAMDMDDLVFGLYCAVDENMRSHGCGSWIMSHMIGQAGSRPFVGHVEKPDERKENQTQRLKRIAFHQRIGLKLTNYEITTNDDTYVIMSTQPEVFDPETYAEMLRRRSLGFMKVNITRSKESSEEGNG